MAERRNGPQRRSMMDESCRLDRSGWAPTQLRLGRIHSDSPAAYSAVLTSSRSTPTVHSCAKRSGLGLGRACSSIRATHNSETAVIASACGRSDAQLCSAASAEEASTAGAIRLALARAQLASESARRSAAANRADRREKSPQDKADGIGHASGPKQTVAKR